MSNDAEHDGRADRTLHLATGVPSASSAESALRATLARLGLLGRMVTLRERHRSGAEAEFESFATRDGGRLLGLAFLLTGDRQDAEDLVQQALLRSAVRWPTARQHPATYTRAVLLNLAKDRWRANQRRHRETVIGDLALLLPAAGDAAATVIDRQLLLQTCRLLPLQQRAVLVLRFWEDRSVEETAAVLGCTAGTVKSHTHRALARLRLALQEAASRVPECDRKEAPC